MFKDCILLATDGSVESDRAAGVAVGLAGNTGAALHVAYVAPVDVRHMTEAAVYAPDAGNLLQETFGGHARDRIAEEAAKLEGLGGEVADTHPAVGRPDAEIVRVAEEVGAGLVVLGSRGLGPLRRAALGSVSLSVVRHAHCPVLVVRGETAGNGAFPRRILLAIDGSDESRAAAETAGEVSKGFGSEMHLAYVLPPEPLPYPRYYGTRKYEEDLLKAQQTSKAYLEEQAEQMEAKGYGVKDVHAVIGAPDHEVVGLAEEFGADLIVLGSRGLGGVRRALLGSVSDSVVRHAHCSVLVVRSATAE